MAAAVGSSKASWGPSNVGFEILTSRRRSDGVGQPTATSCPSKPKPDSCRLAEAVCFPSMEAT